MLNYGAAKCAAVTDIAGVASGSWTEHRKYQGTMRRNGSILVIDDEEIMREILEALLTREGYSVRLAASGAEGLELARSMPFDAAIVDVMMPVMTGLDLLKAVRADPKTSAVAVGVTSLFGLAGILTFLDESVLRGASLRRTAAAAHHLDHAYS